MPGDTSASTQYHITLVHGTFARDATWVRQDSSLCHALTAGLGPNTVFSTFRWSGKNSHTARVTAGRELANFQLDAIAKHPAAKHVVMAHSHGGNIALYAHRLLASQRHAPANIITLATPFIHSGARSRMSWPIRVGWLVFLLLVSLVFPLAILGAGTDPLLDLPANAPLSIRIAILAVYFLFIPLLIYIVFRWYMRRHTRALLEKLAWPLDGRINLLTLSYRWDEARGYLNALDRGVTGLSRGILKFIAVLLLATLLYGGLTLYAAYFNPALYQSDFITVKILASRIPRIFGFLLSMATSTLLLVTIAAIAYAVNVLRGNPLGFGWERPSTTFMIDIRALDTPEGLLTQSVDHHRIAIGDFAKGKKGLAHTVIYDDPRIHDKIISWIKTLPC